jgi:Ca2+-transporting ATPase
MGIANFRNGLALSGQENFHLIPGRLRIEVVGLLKNQDLANAIAHRLALFPGVKISYANPITGQVLVYFDPDRIDLGFLLAWFANGDYHKSPPEGRDRVREFYSEVDVFTLSPSHPLEKGNLPWHAIGTDQTLALLGSSSTTGLTTPQVQNRLLNLGRNELEEDQQSSFFVIAWQSLTGFMSKLLFAAGAVSLWVGQTTDAGVIVTIVLIQAVVEAIQGCRAERSVAELKQLTSPIATVLRNETITNIPSAELVPGDILLLSAGDVVPADALIIESSSLTSDEACLTGESIPVLKDGSRPTEALIPVPDRKNMLYSGTSIIGGKASAVVVATGMRTEMGRIAQLLGGVKPEPTLLQRELDALGKNITRLVVFSVGAIAAINLVRGQSFWKILRNGISLTVGAVPEGLPAVLTVALAAGVQRMAKRNAVVRDLSTVETLGSTTVVCTDKTGTLTKNEMTVKELYIDPDFYQISGTGYTPKGHITLHGNSIIGNRFLLNQALKVAALCNNAHLKRDAQRQWNVVGDPTEGALLTAVAKAGLSWEQLRADHCREREIAFDSDRRLMTVVCRESRGNYGVYVKGAPDTIIDCCTLVLKNQEDAPLDLRVRRRILAACDAMSGKGLRVLALAQKTLPAGTDCNAVELEQELVFCGLVGMADPIRAGVPEAIKKCHAAGIKVVMITGDHKRTADAIAAELGIHKRGRSITGQELSELSDPDLARLVGDITVFSRTAPDQKLRIVRALKKCGQVVAMTGDGINDAPAIKEADIGIAMGYSGTDVARQVAGITLSDDNFVTIVNGIEEGRTIGMNLSKSINYILSGGLGQLVSVFSATAAGLPAPMLPAQILWVNLVTESLPAMALTADPPVPNYMAHTPGNTAARLLPDRGKSIVRTGLISGLSTFGLYAFGLGGGIWPLDKARTMVLAQHVTNRAVNLMESRKQKLKRNPGISSNPFIIAATFMSMSALAVTMYLPLLQPIFSTVPLGMGEWITIAVNSIVTSKIDSLIASKNSDPINNQTLLITEGVN